MNRTIVISLKLTSKPWMEMSFIFNEQQLTQWAFLEGIVKKYFSLDEKNRIVFTENNGEMYEELIEYANELNEERSVVTSLEWSRAKYKPYIDFTLTMIPDADDGDYVLVDFGDKEIVTGLTEYTGKRTTKLKHNEWMLSDLKEFIEEVNNG